MSQSTKHDCKWCAEPLIFFPSGFGAYCNSACRQQASRHKGFVKATWTAELQARAAKRQQRANAAFKARNRDRSFVLDARYEGCDSSAGVDIERGHGHYLPELET